MPRSASPTFTRRSAAVLPALGVCALAVSVLGAPPADARPTVAAAAAVVAKSVAPGVWTNVSGLSGAAQYPTMASFTEPQGMRVGSGLVLVWSQAATSSKQGYRSAVVGPSGGLAAAPADALTGWGNVIANPALVTYNGAPTLAFSGLPDSTGPWAGWNSGRGLFATSSNGGRTFTPQTGSLNASTSTYAGYGFDTTVVKDRLFTVTTQTGTSFGETYSTDVIPNGQSTDTVPQPDLQAAAPNAGCCSYSSAVVQDTGTGTVWSAFYSNADAPGQQGTFYLSLSPTTGGLKRAPGSYTNGSLAPDRRVAAVARVGGGAFIAYTVGYPTATLVRVLDVVTGRYIDVRAAGAQDVGLAAASDGRLWLSWDTGSRVFAARSNYTGTRFGAVVPLNAPKGTVSVFDTQPFAGAGGRLDQVITASTTIRAAMPTNIWHTQAFAGLSSRVSASSVRAGKGGVVTVVVTDAGDAVAGARVRLSNGAVAATNAKGVAVLKVAKTVRKGSLVVTATKSGYRAGAAAVRVG